MCINLKQGKIPLLSRIPVSGDMQHMELDSTLYGIEGTKQMSKKKKKRHVNQGNVHLGVFSQTHSCVHTHTHKHTSE
jgi:hypothetical protein